MIVYNVLIFLLSLYLHYCLSFEDVPYTFFTRLREDPDVKGLYGDVAV